MEKLPASIFNDVIGPVMRGPSSSHVAAASRIGQLIRMSASNQIQSVIVDFDPHGSLAESYHGHGSDIGLVSGLIGIPLTDSRVSSALDLASAQGIDVQFRILDYGAIHPNNYRMKVTSKVGTHHLWEAVSIGGGMIEIQKLDGFSISICGDFYETIILAVPQASSALRVLLSQLSRTEDLEEISRNDCLLIDVKTVQPLSTNMISALRQVEGLQEIMLLNPILPTLSRSGCNVPFRTAAEMLEYNRNKGLSMWQLATQYEAARGDTDEQTVFRKMREIASIMDQAVKNGLSGTHYTDRILGPQAYLMDQQQKKNPLLPGSLLSNVIRNITAVMETKSSFGVIIAAPTAGSCGCLPGTVTGAAETLGADLDTVTRALLAAGLAGVFISEQATFAAEVAGCQAECGAGSSMAAAAVVQMMDGTPQQCVDAASMALQNVSGLVCDPVACRVEVPCLGKNVMGGTNAIASASMILAGYDKVIPFDETIHAMYDIGLKLPQELKCTLGGLGLTPTSMAIRRKLENPVSECPT